MIPRPCWIVEGREGFCNGKLCCASDWTVDGGGVYAFVEPERPGENPLARVTMAESEARFLKAGIDFAPGNT